MNITTTKKVLEGALYAAQRVVSPNNPLQVLTGVLLSVKDEKLFITGTDLNTVIVGSLTPDEIIDEGEVVVSAKFLYELVKRLPDGPISLVQEERAMAVIYGSNTAKAKLYADEYPSMPKVEGVEIEVRTEALLSALQKVIFAAASNEAMGAFAGIFVSATPFGVEFAATNRNIVSYINVDDIKLGDNEFKVIIPRATLEHVKLFSDDKIKVVISNNKISFQGESFLIISRLLAGKHINPATVIPPTTTAECEVNTKEILDTLNRAAIISHNVVIAMDNDTLTISSGGDKGLIVETFQVKCEGKPCTIGLNIKYITDALGAAGTRARLKVYNGEFCLVEQFSYYCFIAGIDPAYCQVPKSA